MNVSVISCTLAAFIVSELIKSISKSIFPTSGSISLAIFTYPLLCWVICCCYCCGVLMLALLCGYLDVPLWFIEDLRFSRDLGESLAALLESIGDFRSVGDLVGSIGDLRSLDIPLWSIEDLMSIGDLGESLVVLLGSIGDLKSIEDLDGSI